MTALFTYPMDATVVSSTTIVGNAAAANCLIDEPARVWRSSGSVTSLYIDLGSAQSFDTVAVVNTNLTAASRVRFTAGTTTAANDYTATGYQNVSVGSFTGTPSHIIKLASPLTYRYVRIMIDNATAALSYTEVGRVVVGKSVAIDGVDPEAEFGFKDFGDKSEYLNRVSFIRSKKVPTMKLKVTLITEAQFRDEWQPMLYSAGNSRGILACIDVENGYQHDRIFGHITTMAKSKHRIHDDHRIDLEIEGFKY